jgi:hypothetical protein
MQLRCQRADPEAGRESVSETKASIVKKKAAALKLKHKLAAEAAAIAVAEHERSARQAANAAAAVEQLRVHHEVAAKEAAALEQALADQEAIDTAPAEEGYLVPPIDRPTLWERFCRWLKNDAS